jgi:hypothetical protein
MLCLRFFLLILHNAVEVVICLIVMSLLLVNRWFNTSVEDEDYLEEIFGLDYIWRNSRK